MKVFVDQTGAYVPGTQEYVEGPDPTPKQSPTLCLNTNLNEFLIVYASGSPGTQDLVVRIVDATEGILTTPPTEIVNFQGSQVALAVSYNPITDIYIIVYQDYLPSNVGAPSVLGVQMLDNNAV